MRNVRILRIMSRETEFSVPDAFKALRERANLSLQELAKAIGYAGASSIQRYESAEYSKDTIDIGLAAKVAKALVGKGEPPITANEVWILARPDLRPSAGIISSFDPDAPEIEYADPVDEIAPEGATYSREHWQPKINGAIPEIDVKLGAGEGIVGEIINLPVGAETVSGHRVVAEWLIPGDYLRNELKVAVNHTLIEEIVGDSMFPTYSPGDRVIIDLTQNRLSTDTVYSISDGMSEPQIKRLQRVPFTDPPRVKIISDNQNLETFEVDLERVHIIGRICGHLSRR
jgi:transcriptional regulator with XRE-family HTH domain